LERHGFKIDHVFHIGGAWRSPKDLAMRALAFARGSEIEEIFIAADLQRWTQVRHLVQRLCELPLPLTLLPDQNMGELFQRTSRQFGETVGIEFQRAPLTVWERSLKRTLDVVVALGGIAALTPMLLIIAVAIKLDSPGPALFKQTRRGFNSREFKIYKFRTMTVLEDGPVIKQAELNDVRITRLGRWLRMTSLDELPQLVNVLSGEMSIVGPRPHAKAHDNQFSDWVSNYAFRHHVKPGITGWAQVHGHRGETPTVEAIRKRVDLDIWYVDNWSVILDIRIIFATVVELLRGRNAV
jgi:putative colanic acid biosynthesis UDP-glucose lipid carrier transferase